MSDGLEGVVAARTVLSHADGESGTVWVRGHTINELVAHGILARDEGGGRSTSYSLAEIKADR